MNYFTGKSFFHTRIKPERERKNDEKRIPARKKRNHWTKHTQFHVKEILIRETESECFERLHGVVKLLSWAILCAIVRAELENQFAGQTRKSEAERFWGGGDGITTIIYAMMWALAFWNILTIRIYNCYYRTHKHSVQCSCIVLSFIFGFVG